MDYRTYIAERHLEPEEREPDCICQSCENWLYGDSAVFISDGRRLCADCFREVLEDLSTSELARLVGADETTAEDLRTCN